MSDFDTRRIGEIALLEDRIRAMSAELTEKKAQAEKWTPLVQGFSGQDAGQITMQFAGRRFTAKLPLEFMQKTDETSAVTAVIETLYENLIAQGLREVVQPEVSKLLANAKSTLGAGKW